MAFTFLTTELSRWMTKFYRVSIKRKSTSLHGHTVGNPGNPRRVSCNVARLCTYRSRREWFPFLNQENGDSNINMRHTPSNLQYKRHKYHTNRSDGSNRTGQNTNFYIPLPRAVWVGCRHPNNVPTRPSRFEHVLNNVKVSLAWFEDAFSIFTNSLDDQDPVQITSARMGSRELTAARAYSERERELELTTSLAYGARQRELEAMLRRRLHGC